MWPQIALFVEIQPKEARLDSLRAQWIQIYRLESPSWTHNRLSKRAINEKSDNNSNLAGQTKDLKRSELKSLLLLKINFGRIHQKRERERVQMSVLVQFYRRLYLQAELKAWEGVQV